MLTLKVLGKDLFQPVLLASGDLPAVLDCDNKTPSLTWCFLYIHTYAKSLQLRPTLCDPMDYKPQAPLSMEFSRQEYWSGLPCPPPWDLPNLGIKPTSPVLAGRFFTKSAPWEASLHICLCLHFLFYKDTQHIGLRTHPTPVWPYLYWLHLNDFTPK